MAAYINGTSALKEDSEKIIPFPSSREQVVETQPAKKKGNYKEGEEQRVYPFKTEEDLQKMHNYFVEKKMWRNDLLFIVGVNVGLRAGDLLELTWGQVFPDNYSEVANGIRIKEEKTDKWRTFYLNESCKKAFLEYFERYTEKGKIPGSDEYIFASRKGNGHIEVRPAGLILKKAAQAVGITYNVGTHSLRKTFGYWQLKAHQNDAMFLCHLQEMFNHATPKVTLRYCGLEDENMEQYYNDVCLL